MKHLIAASLSIVALTQAPLQAASVTFQEGVNGYSGTVDVEYRSDSAITAFPNDVAISVDQNDGSTGDQNNRTQGALRFENIIGDGPGQVPTSEEILFAEVVLYVTSNTADDAVISFNRVLGIEQGSSDLVDADAGIPQDRNRPAGPWQDTDTWQSMGGSVVPRVNPEPGIDTLLLPTNPIEVGDSPALAVGNEALAYDAEPGRTEPLDGRLDPDFNLSDDEFLSIEVTQSVKAWQAGAVNLGWAINNTTGNGWDFLTSDFAVSAYPPESQAGVQQLLDLLGLTEAEARPKLNVVFGVSGDLDEDGDVDADDYTLLRSGLGNQLPNRGGLGDLDFDRDVDLVDFARFKVAFDEVNGAGAFAAMTAAAPEPGSAVLALLAGVVAIFRRR
ncbi:hypothetical protein KOR34_13580 [Posidoniimonas corsicana]|uniref:PEP-CTERM protein-sorting domain-containing protein n=1 Tax=Posidoniimonas corsicana TaxID=1938618 RepID=A0A5C5VFM2_9BACT|nr:hypothetical protein [Posidoniimonas corsicana]TWT36452.1 hypothetical protein KOR34_13580 [Posidoniimonas corsicana]